MHKVYKISKTRKCTVDQEMLVGSWRMLLHMHQVDAVCVLSRWKHREKSKTGLRQSRTILQNFILIRFEMKEA